MAADGELSLTRRAGKSEAAFRTISEVAEELDVPQHVLRFWEGRFPQVRPLKRGGGRRYYRPEDVVLLRRIRDLLYSQGYTIKGVQKLLKEGGTARDAVTAEAETADEPAPPPTPEDDIDDEADDEADAEVESGEAPRFRTALTPELRGEIEAIADELEQLRFLLLGQR